MDTILLTPPEAQKVLRVGKNKIYELLNDRTFPTVKIDKKLFVRRDALEKWLESKSHLRADAAECLELFVSQKYVSKKKAKCFSIEKMEKLLIKIREGILSRNQAIKIIRGEMVLPNE